MTDIVERLRSVGGYFDEPARKIVSVAEVADEIERLRAEIAELRKAHGEPIAEVEFDHIGWRHMVDAILCLPAGTKLYTSAPATNTQQRKNDD